MMIGFPICLWSDQRLQNVPKYEQGTVNSSLTSLTDMVYVWFHARNLL